MTTEFRRYEFPLLKTACQVAFIDDDPEHVETLELFLPAPLVAKASFHTSVATLNEALARSAESFEEEHRTLLNIARLQGDREIGSMVGEPILRYFASPTRTHMIAVVVADHDMPGESGIDLLARISRPGVRRILLTGKADQNKGLDALNGGLIDVYVPKHTENVWPTVRKEIDAQMRVSSDRRGQVLRDTLPADLLGALDAPSCAKQVEDLLARQRVVEYMVVGRPYGVFGVRGDGSAIWVQLETQRTISELVELLGEAGYEDKVVERVRLQKSLVALEWMTQLGREAAEREAVVIGTDPLLIASVFELDALPPEFRPASRQSLEKAA